VTSSAGHHPGSCKAQKRSALKSIKFAKPSTLPTTASSTSPLIN
jgi:hypothetical protein